MEFGVPKEIRDLEKRVGLTPAGVVALVGAGHRVYVERGAGADAGFRDDHYENAGAHVVYSAAEAYGRSDIVLKVVRPTAHEYDLLRPGQTLLAFLHLNVAPPVLHKALATHELTTIAYELIEDEDGNLPVLVPMSEVAGRLAPIVAGQLLTNREGGRGILLSGIPGVARGIVIILGSGTLGRNAARAFVGLGAQVIVLDSDVGKLELVDTMFGGTVSTMIANEFNLNRVVSFADVLVGAVLVPGQRAPILISREMVKRMRPGSVILDFAIDQGGCVETSRPTTLRDPTFLAEGVIHHCVPNLTAIVGRTASHAMTNSALPYLLAICDYGLEGALAQKPALQRGVQYYQGHITSRRLAVSLGRQIDLDLATALAEYTAP
jgi:alanine dehydrogenase